MRLFSIVFTALITSCLFIGQTVHAQSDLISQVKFAPQPFDLIQESADSAGLALEQEVESRNPFDDPIETDRHDFTQSAKVVGCGVAQFEFGVLYTALNEGADRESTFSTPELMFRYGLTERVELRTRVNYAWKFNNQDDDLDGADDMRLGVKYQLSDQKGIRPESAVEFRLSVPTGGSATSMGTWEPGIDLIFEWELTETFSLAGSMGGNSKALGDIGFVEPGFNAADNFILWTSSIAMGAEICERSKGYFEWYGLFTHGREDEASSSFLNFGLDYLLSKNVVVDARIGWGLNDGSDDLFVGFGGGFRF